MPASKSQLIFHHCLPLTTARGKDLRFFFPFVVPSSGTNGSVSGDRYSMTYGKWDTQANKEIRQESIYICSFLIFCKLSSQFMKNKFSSFLPYTFLLSNQH